MDRKIRIDEMCGNLSPENFYQNEVTGANNLDDAKACKYDLYMTTRNIRQWVDRLVNLIKAFNEESEQV